LLLLLLFLLLLLKAVQLLDGHIGSLGPLR
jgi:hypothetical protein